MTVNLREDLRDIGITKASQTAVYTCARETSRSSHLLFYFEDKAYSKACYQIL